MLFLRDVWYCITDSGGLILLAGLVIVGVAIYFSA
jgi:hypothetical protein